MNHQQFKSGRLGAQLTQVQAAERLGLSQSYLSQLEKGQRPVTPEIARLATKVYRLSPAALPLPDAAPDAEESNAARLTRQLSGLGYPGFAHLRAEKDPLRAVAALAHLPAEAMEVVQIGVALWVIDAFQKKSKTGIKTPKEDVDRIKVRIKRLKEALR